MALISTDFATTRESARRLRVEPVGVMTATNVQKALEQVLTAAQVLTPTSVTTTPYTVLSGDTLLLVNVAGASTINLAAAASREGSALIIKDVSGAASTNNITITPNGAETIDGLATVPIATNYGAMQIKPNLAGSGWILLNFG